MSKIFRNYQKDVFRYYLKVNNPLAFLEMRLGKSLITIRWINTLLSKGNVLIISPYSSLFGWEIELIDENNNFIYKVIGTRSQRINVIKENYKKEPENIIFYIVNPFFYKSIPELASLNWKVIVFDEPTFLRNYRTAITQFYWKYFINSFARKVGLTGMPAPEGEHEYYCICKIIEPRSFHEDNYWQFEHNNFGILPNHKRLTNVNGSKYISQRLAKFAYFLSRKDVNLGGEIIREVKYCFMPSRTRTVYTKIEEEFLLQYKDIEETTIFAVTQYLWCRRLCGGMIKDEILDSVKLDLLLELLKGELINQQIIIWCHFNDEILRIESFLKSEAFSVETIYGEKSPIKREQIRKDFQKGSYQFLICQCKCFQYGADLSAANTMIYYSLPESYLTYTQTESRSINIQLNNSILILYLICEDTIDESIYKSLIKKEGRNLMVRRIVNDIQRRIYGRKI